MKEAGSQGGEEVAAAIRRKPAVAPEAIAAELEKILRSDQFRNTHRLSRFLRFVVEKTAQGQDRQIKEHVIGVEVFDRNNSYDPRIDPVVRIEAGRLRARLAEYYQGPGRDDLVLIELPKGSYVAAFRNRLNGAPGASEAAPVTLRPSERADEPEALRPVRQKSKARVFAIAVVGVVLVCLAAWFTTVALRRPQVNSLAVLPFETLSAGPEDQYLSDGVTEELTTALGGVQGLRVIARTSAFQFRGKSEDVREIGRRLGVGAVVEGSVSASGQKLHVTARLISAKSGYPLWSGAYDGERSDIYSIEEQIVQQSARVLGVAASGQEQHFSHRRTESPEAHDLYLAGRYFWYRRDLADLERSIQYFETAIRKDPEYALAYLGLADTYVVMAGNGQKPYAEVMPLARVAVNRALELDASLGEAYVTQAMLFPVWGDQKAKEREFRQAVEANPGYGTSHHWHGVILTAMGRFQEADAELREAQILDPLSPIITEGLAENFYFWRRYDNVIEQVQRIREMRSKLGEQILGAAYIQKHMYQEAIAVFRDLPAEDGTGKKLTYLACAYAASGQTEEAHRLLNQASDAANGYVPPSLTAGAYALLGDKEAAIRWLEKAYKQSDSSAKIKVDPVFDPIHADPRYAELLRKTGYAE